jgi:hypothetical protein
MAQEQPVALSSAPITAVLQRSKPVSKPVLTREPAWEPGLVLVLVSVPVPVWEPVPAQEPVPVLELLTVSQAQPVGQNQVQSPPQASSVP